MRGHPRAEERYLSVERTPVDGSCEICGAEALSSYPVLSEGGWWNVTKCQGCLASISRERAGFFGGLELETGKIPGVDPARVFGAPR